MSETLKAWCHWKRKEKDVSEDDLLFVKSIEDVISQVGTWEAKARNFERQWRATQEQRDKAYVERDELTKLNSDGCDSLAESYEIRNELQAELALMTERHKNLKDALWYYAYTLKVEDSTARVILEADAQAAKKVGSE